MPYGNPFATTAYDDPALRMRRWLAQSAPPQMASAYPETMGTPVFEQGQAPQQYGGFAQYMAPDWQNIAAQAAARAKWQDAQDRAAYTVNNPDVAHPEYDRAMARGAADYANTPAGRQSAFQQATNAAMASMGTQNTAQGRLGVAEATGTTRGLLGQQPSMVQPFQAGAGDVATFGAGRTAMDMPYGQRISAKSPWQPDVRAPVPQPAAVAPPAPVAQGPGARPGIQENRAQAMKIFANAGEMDQRAPYRLIGDQRGKQYWIPADSTAGYPSTGQMLAERLETNPAAKEKHTKWQAQRKQEEQGGRTPKDIRQAAVSARKGFGPQQQFAATVGAGRTPTEGQYAAAGVQNPAMMNRWLDIQEKAGPLGVLMQGIAHLPPGGFTPEMQSVVARFMPGGNTPSAGTLPQQVAPVTPEQLAALIPNPADQAAYLKAIKARDKEMVQKMHDVYMPGQPLPAEVTAPTMIQRGINAVVENPRTALSLAYPPVAGPMAMTGALDYGLVNPPQWLAPSWSHPKSKAGKRPVDWFPGGG